MSRSRIAFRILSLVGLVLSPGFAGADSGAPVAPGMGIAIVDFAYVDTSNEPADQAVAHQRRLQGFMAALRRDFGTDGPFHLVPVSCRPVSCADDRASPAELVRAATDAGAGILVVGGIHKQSTLIQWAKVEAIDIAANRVILDKLFTFRGDSDEAWDRAEAFVFREIRTAMATPAAAPTPAPIKLALFDFEFEDFSAGASSSGPAPSDLAQLTGVTSEVRNLFAETAGYRLVDVADTAAAAAKAHALHDCNGCDAAIAQTLGAEQSFVGVVKRISRTEYTVRFQIRDARTGAVVSHADSGLRMGADSSWSRGAVQLIKDRLLDSPARQ